MVASVFPLLFLWVAVPEALAVVEAVVAAAVLPVVAAEVVVALVSGAGAVDVAAACSALRWSFCAVCNGPKCSGFLAFAGAVAGAWTEAGSEVFSGCVVIAFGAAIAAALESRFWLLSLAVIASFVAVS